MATSAEFSAATTWLDVLTNPLPFTYPSSSRPTLSEKPKPAVTTMLRAVANSQYAEASSHRPTQKFPDRAYLRVYLNAPPLYFYEGYSELLRELSTMQNAVGASVFHHLDDHKTIAKCPLLRSESALEARLIENLRKPLQVLGSLWNSAYVLDNQHTLSYRSWNSEVSTASADMIFSRMPGERSYEETEFETEVSGRYGQDVEPEDVLEEEGELEEGGERAGIETGEKEDKRVDTNEGQIDVDEGPQQPQDTIFPVEIKHPSRYTRTMRRAIDALGECDATVVFGIRQANDRTRLEWVPVTPRGPSESNDHLAYIASGDGRSMSSAAANGLSLVLESSTYSWLMANVIGATTDGTGWHATANVELREPNGEARPAIMISRRGGDMQAAQDKDSRGQGGEAQLNSDRLWGPGPADEVEDWDDALAAIFEDGFRAGVSTSEADAPVPIHLLGLLGGALWQASHGGSRNKSWPDPHAVAEPTPAYLRRYITRAVQAAPPTTPTPHRRTSTFNSPVRLKARR